MFGIRVDSENARAKDSHFALDRCRGIIHNFNVP